jgi:hypothetical protein
MRAQDLAITPLSGFFILRAAGAHGSNIEHDGLDAENLQ